MNYIYLIIFILVIAIVTTIILYSSKSKETFTSFEENLLDAFKNNELSNFIKYLKFLNDNKNEHINLVNESVYNSLKNKQNLTIDYIKSFI